MKKYLLLFALLISAVPATFAQKLLSVEDTTDGIGVYPCGERKEALVKFITHETFGLNFSSNYDSELNVELDSVAGTKTYSIVFVTQAPGVDYSGRRVTIKAPGFKDFTLPLNLQTKQKIEFTVSDPYSALRSPYFIYQDKGNDLFYSGEYQGAKDCYEMIKACPEYQLNKASIDEHIAICDSMMEWSTEALRKEHFAQFNDATELYYKMLRYNSSSMAIQEKISNAQYKFAEDCKYELTLAEHFMDQGNTEQAKACYNRIIEKQCNTIYVEQATSTLAYLERKESKSRESARCLFYDWAPNQEIGLTFAQCYSQKRRSSGYITARMNTSLFKMMMGKSSADGSLQLTEMPSGRIELVPYAGEEYFKYDNYIKNEEHNWEPKNGELDFEASMSFGWTVRTWRYFFIHFGIGYHGGGFYSFDQSETEKAVTDWKKDRPDWNLNTPFNEWDDKLRNDCMKANWFNGVAPEGGLIVKVWRFNVKATYQYTFWLNKDGYTDFLDKNTTKLALGVGFNW
ncbi:MAG: hypothetical protein J6P82_02150 [Bacteroidales bacterium]|nr:hypothetical protein [Bacteroidales bacterium]MBO7378368.1 hypothetical protein [Bacteroidales bacterium]